MKPWMWSIALVAVCIAVHVAALRTPLFLDDAYEMRRALAHDWHQWLFAYCYDSPNGDVPWWFGQIFERRVVRVLPSVILSGELRVFGENAIALHLTSLACVAGTAVLVQRLLARWTGDLPAATLAALVFAVHPASGEIVALASNLAAAVAGLASAVAVTYWERMRRTGARRDLVLALVAAYLAITSYEAALLVPIAIVAIDWYVARDKAWQPRIAMLALYVLYVPLVLYVQHGTEHPDYQAMRPIGTVLHALRIDTEAYVAKTFVAFNAPEPSSYWLQNAIGELATVGLALLAIAGLVLGAAHRRLCVLGILVFGAALAPPLVVRAAVSLLNIPSLRQIYLPVAFGLTAIIASVLARPRHRIPALAVAAAFAAFAAVQGIRMTGAAIYGNLGKLTDATRTALDGQDRGKTLVVIGDNRCGFHPQFVWGLDVVRLFPASKKAGEEVALTKIDDHTLEGRAPSGFDRIVLDTVVQWPEPPGTYNAGRFYTLRYPAFTREQTTLAIPGATLELVERTDKAPTVLRAHLDRPLSESIVLLTKGCDAAQILQL